MAVEFDIFISRVCLGAFGQCVSECVCVCSCCVQCLTCIKYTLTHTHTGIRYIFCVRVHIVSVSLQIESARFGSVWYGIVYDMAWILVG